MYMYCLCSGNEQEFLNHFPVQLDLGRLVISKYKCNYVNIFTNFNEVEKYLGKESLFPSLYNYI